MPGTSSSANHLHPRGQHRQRALTDWPRAWKEATELERECWREIGRAALAAGTISAVDLIQCRSLASVMALVRETLANPEVQPTKIASLIRVQSDLLKSLGLVSSSRRAVDSLPADEQDDKDPLSEFG